MKRIYLFIFVSLLIASAVACTCTPKDANEDVPAAEQSESEAPFASDASPLWNLGDRYESNYSTIRHTYKYRKNTDAFYLTVSRSKKTADKAKNVLDTFDLDGRTYLYSELTTENVDNQQEPVITAQIYEHYTGTFRYQLGNGTYWLDMKTVLSFDEAAALMQYPTVLPQDTRIEYEEWSYFFRTEECALSILIYPQDDGAMFEQLCEENELADPASDADAEYSASSEIICYHDARGTVLINQLNYTKDAVSNLTVERCSEFLALLA